MPSASCHIVTICSTGTTSWRSLLLPSSPTAQAGLGPLHFQSLGSLVSNMMNINIQQDFHLPDDQFASLKLHKLRHVAMESEVESFASPYNTRNSVRLFCDTLTPLPLPFSLTPTIKDSPCFSEDKQVTLQAVKLQDLSIDHKLANESVAEVASHQPDTTDAPGEQHTHCASSRQHETVTSNSSVSTSVTAGPADTVNVSGPEITQPASEKQKDCTDVVCPLATRPDHKTITKNLKAVEMCDDPEAPGDSAVKRLNVRSGVDSEARCELTSGLIGDKSGENHGVHSQLLLSPPLASAPCPFITPHPPSSAHLSSPTLPSLGATPRPVFPLTSSPSAPSLTPPSPNSPCIQALSPPVVSSCPSITSLPSSLSHAPPSSQTPSSLDQCHRIEPSPSPTPCKILSQGSHGLVSRAIQDTAKEHMLSGTHTLKVRHFCILGSELTSTLSKCVRICIYCILS